MRTAELKVNRHQIFLYIHCLRYTLHTQLLVNYRTSKRNDNITSKLLLQWEIPEIEANGTFVVLLGLVTGHLFIICQFHSSIQF